MNGTMKSESCLFNQNFSESVADMFSIKALHVYLSLLEPHFSGNSRYSRRTFSLTWDSRKRIQEKRHIRNETQKNTAQNNPFIDILIFSNY